jgi:4-hydroxy-tetrahydrodipicolinate synthase
MKKLEGVLTAIVTPFTDEGELDLEAVDRLVERQLDAGVHGIVVAGTTGEGSSLLDDERRVLFERVVARVDGQAAVVGGAGTNSLHSTVRYLHMAKDAGMDAALVVTPYYVKPTPDGLVGYYAECIRQVQIPVVVYNVPSRTACDLVPATLARIAAEPLAVAVKEATGDMARVIELHRDLGRRISILSGDDATFLPLLACGGDGIIATSANVDPSTMVAVYETWKAGNFDKALELQASLMGLYRAMFVESNPGPVKHALSRMHLVRPVIRPPLAMPTRESQARIDAAITRYLR